MDNVKANQSFEARIEIRGAEFVLSVLNGKRIGLRGVDPEFLVLGNKVRDTLQNNKITSDIIDGIEINNLKVKDTDKEYYNGPFGVNEYSEANICSNKAGEKSKPSMAIATKMKIKVENEIYSFCFE